MSLRTIRKPLARLWPTLLVCLLACNSADTVDPNQNPPDDPNTPNNPNNPNTPGSPGFSILTLLHGTQSAAADQVRDIALDTQGNIYVTGGTADHNFPTTANAYQRTFGRGQASTGTGSEGNWDVFVMKFTPDGQLVWSTLLGGGNYDRTYALEVDGTGIYLAGRAGDGFPTTAGAMQASFAGDSRGSGAYGRQDGFIAKLSLDGSTLIWATYFGGPSDEYIRDLAVDPNGDLYPAVAIAKVGFPYITAGAYQATNRGQSDGAICRIAAGGGSVRWCTFLGGSGEDGIPPTVRLDGAGNVYYLQGAMSSNVPTTAGAYQAVSRGGTDLHLSKFSSTGALLWATYFGGSGTDQGETHNMWVTPNGEAYIAGNTTSADLPVTSGALQPQSGGGTLEGFVARFSADGRQLLASTYLGGSGGDAVEGIGLDGSGNVVISGSSQGGGFTTAGAPQPNVGGSWDGFIAVLAPDLTSLSRGTFLGGSGSDAGRTIAVDWQRNVIYTGGNTESSNFPTAGTAFLTQYAGRDGFLAGWRP